MPRVVFRCDATRATGSGHLARCMALAHALHARGADIDVVVRDLPPRARELLIAPIAATVHELGAPTYGHANASDEGAPLAHADWLAVPQRVDAQQTIEALRAHSRPDWLIVDHYALDTRWERMLRPHVGGILAIDDLADREHDCDALLDQNFFREPHVRYDALVPHHATRMLGPKYSLLRAEFGAARERLGERTGELERVFVCFGGFDVAQQTMRALHALEQSGLDLHVDVIIPGDHPQRAAIERWCRGRTDAHVHHDADEIAALMAAADLAIGASGTMNWERAALSLPSIIASVAENQHLVGRELAADRACVYLGLAHEWTADTLAALLRGLKGTPALLAALAARAGALTDGRGAQRVAARLLPEPIELRRATAADCDAIHAWRNAEETRRHSGDARPIALDEHRRWFARVLQDAQVALLVGEHAGSAAGVLRYDVAGEEAVVSIYMVPGRHGQGLGTALLRAGAQWLRRHHPAVRRIRAEIRRDNTASLEAFANAGFGLERHTYVLDLAHG
ncbi:MAG TPA: UDP-2,4-diacetamido-2,4,6-trideoxy-beta-L-altropyranose hydrolase [Burkholderiales bacterium]|nr:UDP-2,4-diacetamido-2,4,6-trideoxy-beta-L-altropyranose hydrolase [Burkholderiales bacterium]